MDAEGRAEVGVPIAYLAWCFLLILLIYLAITKMTNPKAAARTILRACNTGFFQVELALNATASLVSDLSGLQEPVNEFALGGDELRAYSSCHRREVGAVRRHIR